MFRTAVKTCLIEALTEYINVINPGSAFPQGYFPSDTTNELTPTKFNIEYPLVEASWPSIYVHFTPITVQWTGLDPDFYYVVSGTEILCDRQIYFEGYVDFQVLALASEERDKLADSIDNLVLFDVQSPASTAFYNSIYENELVGIQILGSKTRPIGDTIVPGTPFSAEILSYEYTSRVQCVGQAYEPKYDYNPPILSSIVVSGMTTYSTNPFVFTFS
jgi:hypothetical protein